MNNSVEKAIETDKLTKIFPDKTVAVDNLSINLDKGKIYGFLGPNGAGKTTTISLLMGILKPTHGSMKVLGIDPTSSKKFELRKRIGFMPQDVSLYDDLTPLEHCVFFGRLNGMKRKEAKTSSLELLEFFGLKEKMNTPVHNLSGGMKRRTSLTVALVHHPELIIMDEPTVGVDPVLRRNFWDYFHKLKSQGVTFLVTTHVFDEVVKMDTILLMYRGKIIEQGTADQLQSKHKVSSLEEIFLHIADQEIQNDNISSSNQEEVYS